MTGFDRLRELHGVVEYGMVETQASAGVRYYAQHRVGQLVQLERELWSLRRAGSVAGSC